MSYFSLCCCCLVEKLVSKVFLLKKTLDTNLNFHLITHKYSPQIK